jgi:hypothetical protein
MSVRKKAKGGYHRRNTTPIHKNPQNTATESTEFIDIPDDVVGFVYFDGEPTPIF